MDLEVNEWVICAETSANETETVVSGLKPGHLYRSIDTSGPIN